MSLATCVSPTGQERFFGEEEVIVSKTDLQGRITYANQVFLRVAGYEEDEILGKPHNVIRHPDMPRCVFKLLWDRLRAQQEVFAYVVNLARNGDHYWVFAHVTPSLDRLDRVVGYHSNRRVPSRSAVSKASALYRELLDIERREADGRAGMLAAERVLQERLEQVGMPYEQFVFAI